MQTEIVSKQAGKGLSNSEALERANSASLISLMDGAIDRGYLAKAGELGEFALEEIKSTRVTWLQLLRLPVDPSSKDPIDLMSYWQNALATFNVWGNRFLFLLIRSKGETKIYFGVAALSAEMNAKTANKQIRQAASAAMPGIELESVADSQAVEQIAEKLLDFQALGTITGMPSLRESAKGKDVQTLDALAFGFKGEYDEYTDYAVLVNAQPVDEDQLNTVIGKLRDWAGAAHALVKANSGRSTGESGGTSVGGGLTLFHLLSLNKGAFASTSTGESISWETLDKSAEYVESIVNASIERLKKGKNLGFWNTGVYVLGKTNSDVKTVLGLLKSVYAGDASYIEPIRANVFRHASQALDIVRSFQLIPYPFSEQIGHPLGSIFNYISTPMNTEELSIVTSLPRKDVPGIRFSKTAVRFATNPAEVAEQDAMVLGNVMDMGIVQTKAYRMNPDALVRHALVSGCTGSGKSTTCKKFLSEINKRGIPSLIVEPAKDDYVRWAIRYNQMLEEDSSLSPEEKDALRYDIYMPGIDTLDGYKMKRLKLNPFEPAAIAGAPIDLVSRYEQATAIINASIPASDVLPILIDESIYKFMELYFKEDFCKTEAQQRMEYPKLEGLLAVAREVLRQRNYDSKVQNDIAAAMDTRLQYLTRGKRGEILNVRKSTDYSKLFGRRSVINLSRLVGLRDKSLVMSFLIVALYEYRSSAFTYDSTYREKAGQNKLLHLTLIEEAHNLLQKPESDLGQTGNPQKVSADMFTNILSEIRSYGEGIIIVDQVPTRLIPDAVKNTNYKIVHRLTAADDAQALASSMALSEEQVGIISKLKIGEAIVFGDLDDAALWVKIKN